MPIKVIREVHETPEYIAARLALAGGLNRFGEPNYRAVWGWNRLTPIGGRWADKGVVEVRTEPKYPQVNRWHIEKWCPPEMYGTREQWELETTEEGVLALGPYPSRGEYEHAMVLEGRNGEFIQLTSTVVEYIAGAIERSRLHPRSHGRRALYNREAKKDAEYMTWADMVMDDNATWLHTPHSYIPAKLKEKIQ